MSYIIIATEDSALAQTLQGEVEAEGYATRWCVTGQEVYDSVLEMVPDLVFLNNPLAVFDAFQTCEMLRADPEVPASLAVVLVTNSEPDSRRLETAGLSDSLLAAHTRQDLRELLSVYLSGRAPG